MSYKPDFKRAYMLANRILLISRSINTFPFSITKVIKELSDIQCRSFKKAYEYGVDIEAFGSESAVLIECMGRSIIFYNQDEREERVRFSMLHEIGHYLLEHKMDTHDKALYDKQEIETNFFAAQLLMPEQTLQELQTRGKRITVDFLVDSFRVSKEAANKRIDSLQKINPKYRTEDEREFDDLILLKYESFLSKILPKRNIYNMFDDEEERQRDRESWY